MKLTIKNWLPLAVVVALSAACTKMRDTGITNGGNFTDTTSALKDASDITLGVGIDYNPMLTDAKYSSLVKGNFDAVTFGYQMKHGAIVKDNGTLDFTSADALVAAVGSMDIYGHTLGWHQNQNATYLKNYAGITLPAATELLPNNDFEAGSSSAFNNWSTYNAQNGATVSVTTAASEIHGGTRAMKVVNPVANTGNQWKVQVAGDLFNTTVGKTYLISYWVKAAAAGGSIRISTGTTAQYQGDQTIGVTWQQITWTITAKDAQTRILFDMGQVADTYYIDDASVKEVIVAPSGAQVADKLDTALKTFITGTVTHFKSKVHAWDVINELFADDGNIRNNNNTTTTGSDVLVWSNYMGRDYALKAFTYAHNTDPAALLFINDYALENKTAKIDSLIAFVAELKSKGAQVDGIGTQMHVSWNSTYDGIDNMMKKLAATGLKIRISELDVKINPTSKVGFMFTTLQADYQAAMYQYVIKSYLTYVPAAQRYGITIWGINDSNSWLYNNGTDYPLLFNSDYSKKPAYAAVLQTLKGQ